MYLVLNILFLEFRFNEKLVFAVNIVNPNKFIYFIGNSLFGKEVEEEDFNTLQEIDETLDDRTVEREVDSYHEVNERDEDELMSKLESILEELRQLE